MFLMGRVATNDGTAVPNDVLVERICNANVRQQVHATSRGDFSMQMGSMTDSFLDASASATGVYKMVWLTRLRGRNITARVGEL